MSEDAAANRPAPDNPYILDNAWEQARRRLELLHEVHDPGTIARLERLGVGPGWRVFVPGGGAGSIVRWLGERVGPTGRVLSTDIDPRFLEEVDEPAVEIRRHDIVRDPPPDERFDLIQVRLLLIHLPEREEVLERLVNLLEIGALEMLSEALGVEPKPLEPGTPRRIGLLGGQFLESIGGGPRVPFQKLANARQGPAQLAQCLDLAHSPGSHFCGTTYQNASNILM